MVAVLSLALLSVALLTFLLVFTLFMGRIGNYALLVFAPVAVLAVLVSVSSGRAAGRKRERAQAAPGHAPEAPLGGVWEGTARLWPGTPDKVLRLLPVRMRLGGRPLEAELLPCVGRQDREHITAIDLLEYDPTHRHLNLSVTVDQFDHHETFTARLRRPAGAPGVLVPDDDTELFTLELHRLPTRTTRRTGAPRRHGGHGEDGVCSGDL